MAATWVTIDRLFEVTEARDRAEIARLQGPRPTFVWPVPHQNPAKKAAGKAGGMVHHPSPEAARNARNGVRKWAECAECEDI